MPLQRLFDSFNEFSPKLTIFLWKTSRRKTMLEKQMQKFISDRKTTYIGLIPVMGSWPI
jgi:hypothetical protein